MMGIVPCKFNKVNGKVILSLFISKKKKKRIKKK